MFLDVKPFNWLSTDQRCNNRHMLNDSLWDFYFEASTLHSSTEVPLNVYLS